MWKWRKNIDSRNKIIKCASSMTVTTFTLSAVIMHDHGWLFHFHLMQKSIFSYFQLLSAEIVLVNLTKSNKNRDILFIVIEWAWHIIKDMVKVFRYLAEDNCNKFINMKNVISVVLFLFYSWRWIQQTTCTFTYIS